MARHCLGAALAYAAGATLGASRHSWISSRASDLSAGCQQRSRTQPRVAPRRFVFQAPLAGLMWCRARRRWTTRRAADGMACKGSGVQIPSAPPQVRGPLRLRPLLIRPPRAADGQQSVLPGRSGRPTRLGAVAVVARVARGLPAAGGWVVSHGFAACCAALCVPVWPGPKISYPATGRIWPRPTHQFHPPGRRAWQPVAGLESSPAAKSDGRESARTADPCGFSPVLVIRISSGSSA